MGILICGLVLYLGLLLAFLWTRPDSPMDVAMVLRTPFTMRTGMAGFRLVYLTFSYFPIGVFFSVVQCLRRLILR